MNATTEDSFISAWSKARFPDENRAFVKSFCDEIGISGFEYVPADYRYIVATRRDVTGELRIHWGCTTGFTEAEAESFRVSHPEHRDVSLCGPAGDSSTPAVRRCPQCNSYELLVTGICPGCDDH